MAFPEYDFPGIRGKVVFRVEKSLHPFRYGETFANKRRQTFRLTELLSNIVESRSCNMDFIHPAKDR